MASRDQDQTPPPGSRDNAEPEGPEREDGVEPAEGRAVWRMGKERAVSDLGHSEPYGPEDDTTRPAEEPQRATRRHPAADPQGISPPSARDTDEH